MTSRRAFIEAGLAAPFISPLILDPVLAQTSADGSQTLQLERFIHDVRFAECNVFARSMGSHNIGLSPVADDLMRLWYDELDLLWKQSPMTLGGVTMPEAIFVLETLALDRGMRVVYRGEHSAQENGKISHNLHAPAGMIAGVGQDDRNWADSLARAMTQCPAQPLEYRELSFQTHADAPALRDVPLVSWIIAPR